MLVLVEESSIPEQGYELSEVPSKFYLKGVRSLIPKSVYCLIGELNFKFIFQCKTKTRIMRKPLSALIYHCTY